ncbi:adenylate kinase [Chloroflexota bacterium]
MNIIFLGAPGAGKGTQAAMVAEELKLKHIATGDMFREVQQQDTELAREVKNYMENGKLVPDETTIKMVLERIAAPDCKGGVIFDGFPRSLGQAESLDTALSEQSKVIDKVVYIRVAEKELLKRLSGRWICRQCQAPYHEVSSPPEVAGKCDKCGGELYQRADDNIETIKKRLGVYFEETAPLIDYYTQAGKLLEVDGVGDLGEVRNRILTSLSGSMSA